MGSSARTCTALMSATPMRSFSSTPKRVLYEIFGPPGTVADINYLDADAQPQRVDGATLPWSFELVTTLTAVAANVVAQGNSDTIGCHITVNGQVRESIRLTDTMPRPLAW